MHTKLQARFPLPITLAAILAVAIVTVATTCAIHNKVWAPSDLIEFSGSVPYIDFPGITTPVSESNLRDAQMHYVARTVFDNAIIHAHPRLGADSRLQLQHPEIVDQFQFQWHRDNRIVFTKFWEANRELALHIRVEFDNSKEIATVYVKEAWK